ncbi:MAG: SDR family oxidoreductase [Phycisphaerales bacterium]|nr:SDR family oxidoreductase [Phycisphaerales bacterium]MCB9836305.1 SDR family oxidoreductase [Phycisphaera sp.]
MPELPVSIVTGAGSGIGLAVSQQLSQMGHHVVLVGRREGVLKEAAAALAGPSSVMPCDISQLAQARSVIDQVKADLGRIDVLVSNAGWAELHAIDKTDDETLDLSFRINALGPAAMISQAWPVFTAQKSGCIVCTSSMATQDPFPGFFAYASSKASVNLLVASCAKEGSRHGVRAFAIAPGAVETALLRSMFDQTTLPADVCMKPETVAAMITACVRGEHDAENGRVIWMPNA